MTKDCQLSVNSPAEGICLGAHFLLTLQKWNNAQIPFLVVPPLFARVYLLKYKNQTTEKKERGGGGGGGGVITKTRIY